MSIHVTVNAVEPDRTNLADTLRMIADRIEQDYAAGYDRAGTGPDARRYHFSITEGAPAQAAYAAVAEVIAAMDTTEQDFPLLELTCGDYLADLARNLGRQYPHQAREGADLSGTPAPAPRVEVLAYRDPDAATEVSVWVDGTPADFTEEHVDPGAGYVLSEWREDTARVQASEDYSPDFRAAVVDAREGAEDSECITDDTDED